MRIRRSIQHVLLSLLLLLSQQMGVAHAVSHLSDVRQQTSQNKQLPVEQMCEQCLAYAQIGSALTSAAVLPVVQIAASVVVDGATAQYFSLRTVYAFQSRAPPQ